MSYHPNPIETEKVNNFSAPERYEYFVKKVVDFKEVWSLRADDGWATSFVNNKYGFPFWPAQIFAENCLEDHWSSYYASSITLNEFIKEWLPDMVKDDMFVAVFPIHAGKSGILVDPKRLIYDLECEREGYDADVICIQEKHKGYK